MASAGQEGWGEPSRHPEICPQQAPLGGRIAAPEAASLANCPPFLATRTGNSVPVLGGLTFLLFASRPVSPAAQRGCQEPRKRLTLLQRCFSPICSTHPHRASLPHRAACKASCSNRRPSCSPLDDAQSALSRIITAAAKDKRAGIGRDGLPFFHATEKQKEVKGRHSWLQQAPNPTCSDSK